MSEIPEVTQAYDEDSGTFLVTVRWNITPEIIGAIMFYPGDELADFTWRSPTHGYAQAGIEFRLSEGVSQRMIGTALTPYSTEPAHVI